MKIAELKYRTVSELNLRLWQIEQEQGSDELTEEYAEICDELERRDEVLAQRDAMQESR